MEICGVKLEEEQTSELEGKCGMKDGSMVQDPVKHWKRLDTEADSGSWEVSQTL